MKIWLVLWDYPQVSLYNEIDSAWDTLDKAKNRLRQIKNTGSNFRWWIKEVKIYS